MQTKDLQAKYPTVFRGLRHYVVHGTPVKLMDEEVLLDECRKMNRHAQKKLFETYYKKMIPVCLRYLKNESDALEVINTAFLKVFNKISQYKSEGSLEAWIRRIVINASIDFVRTNKSYRANFIHTNEFNFYGEPQEPDEPELPATPDLTQEEIFKMVAELPQATRVVFNLFVIDEFTHKQIAENLKISEGTSKWHLSNARKLLKEKFKLSTSAKNKTSNGSAAAPNR